MQLAVTPDARWTFTTEELLSAAGAAGFAAVGINVDRVKPATPDAYASAGVRCHELLAMVVGDDEPAALTAAEHLAGHARSVGAQWVLTVFNTPPRARCIQRCAKVFDDAGTAMAVEFSPLGPVSTISDGLDVVRAARRGGRAGLMIDLWHFCFGESTWDDLAHVPLDDIAYVQFTDALEPESRQRLVRETLHRRTVPGEGVLELDRFASTLLDRGWDGIVSVEVLSAELRELPIGVLIGRLYDTTAPYWG